MSRTIVVPRDDEKSANTIRSFNKLAKRLGKTQPQLILEAMEEFVSRHWSEVANPYYKIPNENIEKE